MLYESKIIIIPHNTSTLSHLKGIITIDLGLNSNAPMKQERNLRVMITNNNYILRANGHLLVRNYYISLFAESSINFF